MWAIVSFCFNIWYLAIIYYLHLIRVSLLFGLCITILTTNWFFILWRISNLHVAVNSFGISLFFYYSNTLQEVCLSNGDSKVFWHMIEKNCKFSLRIFLLMFAGKFVWIAQYAIMLILSLCHRSKVELSLPFRREGFMLQRKRWLLGSPLWKYRHL